MADAPLRKYHLVGSMLVPADGLPPDEPRQKVRYPTEVYLAEDVETLLAEVDRLSRLLKQREDEIKVDEQLLATRQQILDACPCPDHGSCCVPHVLDELKRLAELDASRLLGAQPEPPALLDALRTYGQHQTGCRKSQCKTCGCSLVGGDHEDSYNGHTSWHPFVWGDCTCGLDAALASPRVREGETP